MAVREVASGRLALLKVLGHAGGRRVAALVAVLAVRSLLPALFAVTTGAVVAFVPDAVVDGVGSSAGDRLTSAIIAVAVLLVLERVVTPLHDVVRWSVARAVDGALRDHVLGLLERPAGIAHVEHAQLQDQLTLLRGGLFGTVGGASVAAAWIVARYLQTAATLTVVAWFSVPLALLLLVVLLVIRIRWHRAFGELAGAIVGSGHDLRKVTYTVDLAITPPAAKELRVFGLLDWLLDRARDHWEAAVARPFEVRRRLRDSANLELALLGLGYLVTFVVVVRAAVVDDVSLGVVAAVLQAVFVAAELISPSSEDFATPAGIAALRAIDAVTSVTTSAPTATGTHPANGMPRTAVTFEEVSFTYPGAERPVLDCFSLTVVTGESLALVGLNGAGKTTLVKLLTGLYQPTAGRILVDGVDLADLDLAGWRHQVGVIFQDFVHYDLSLRDNVALPAPGAVPDEEAVARALRMAGAAGIAEALPFGLDTRLSRQYEQGAELSGGEWQRVALARALYAVEVGSRLLVLDEPTANLDVRAEAALFDAFLEWTAGATSILISHRFSTVRRAGRIVVLADGAIVEDGSHDELLAAGGPYAEMFRAQAQQFAEVTDA